MSKGISIEQAKKQIHEKALKAMKESGMQLEAQVKLNTPVLTGALRRSITSKVEDKDNKIELEIGSYGIIYAHKIDQQSGYLEGTIDSNLEQIRRKMKEVLSE